MGDIAVLSMRPASIGEKPPIVRIEVSGVPLAEIHARLVMIRPGTETKNAVS